MAGERKERVIVELSESPGVSKHPEIFGIQVEIPIVNYGTEYDRLRVSLPLLADKSYLRFFDECFSEEWTIRARAVILHRGENN